MVSSKLLAFCSATTVAGLSVVRHSNVRDANAGSIDRTGHEGEWPFFTPGGSTIALVGASYGAASMFVNDIEKKAEEYGIANAESKDELNGNRFAEESSSCGDCAAGMTWCATEGSEPDNFYGKCVSGASVLGQSTSQCFADAGECPVLRHASHSWFSPSSFVVRPTHPDGRPEWDNTPYVSKEHKLVFCEIPKVACSDFKRLFRRLNGAQDFESQAPWVHDPKQNGITRLTDMPSAEAASILKDPTWTKGVFIRDPMERLLSGFLDKCREPIESRYDIHCPFSGHVSFGEFMDYIFTQADYNVHGKMSMDEHWRPQHLVCDLERWLPYYQFQGNFSHLQTHTKFLLQGVGIFDEFGRGWGDDGLDIFEKKIDWHHTDTSEKLTEYYTKELADKAMAFYNTDYELFQLPKPAWYYELQ